MIREPRKVESESEPRNFIKDKLCAIGLADVSQECDGGDLYLLVAVFQGCGDSRYPVRPAGCIAALGGG